MQKVFVLDTRYKQLDMCHPGQARRLLKAGLAAVHKEFPFTIILKREVLDPQLQPYFLKLDPGSKKTGVAIVNQETGEVVFAAEIEHRGETIKTSLDSRRGLKKGSKTASEFGYPQVQAQAKLPLKDAAAVNTTRWEIYNRLKLLGLPLETGSGGLTKFNRRKQNLAKAHWTDAACVGVSTPQN